MDNIDPALLSSARARAEALNLSDSGAVMAFGARAQSEMGTFTSLALSRMLETDTKPMERTLELLLTRIRDCDVTRIGKGLLSKLFGGAQVNAIRDIYEKNAPVIENCANEMTDYRVALLRDHALLERLYEKNEQLYQQLSACAVGASEKLERERKKLAAEQVGTSLADAQTMNDKKNTLHRFERKVADLELSRTASMQLGAQLRMVQESDLRTADRLNTALNTTLPLWRAQMMTALGMARAVDAMDLCNAAARSMAGNIRQNARTLSAQRKDYTKKATSAKDMERAAAQGKALLEELEQIERSLKEQNTLREGTA